MRKRISWGRLAACVCLTLALGTLAACGGGAGSNDTEAPAAPGNVGGGPPAGGGGTPAGTPPPTGQRITSGVVATFIQAGEQFTVWITNPVEAQLMWDIANHRANFTSVSGTIATGSGFATHNAPWTWHLDPASVRLNRPVNQFVRFPGLPSQVEANVAGLVAMGKVKQAGNGDTRLFFTVDLRGDVPTSGEPPSPPLPPVAALRLPDPAASAESR